MAATGALLVALWVAWRMRRADGSTLLDGAVVAVAASDGRLRRVVGFHDPLPALADPNLNNGLAC